MKKKHTLPIDKGIPIIIHVCVKHNVCAFLFKMLPPKVNFLLSENVYRVNVVSKQTGDQTHQSPNCTALRTPTAAVLCQSKLWPT